MFRKMLCALVVCAAIVPDAYSSAATLGVTPPMRPVYPTVHLNTPLHSRISPRFDHEVWQADNCAQPPEARSTQARNRDCRAMRAQPRRRH
jgi:hypothetical protein